MGRNGHLNTFDEFVTTWSFDIIGKNMEITWNNQIFEVQVILRYPHVWEVILRVFGFNTQFKQFNHETMGSWSICDKNHQTTGNEPTTFRRWIKSSRRRTVNSWGWSLFICGYFYREMIHPRHLLIIRIRKSWVSLLSCPPKKIEHIRILCKKNDFSASFSGVTKCCKRKMLRANLLHIIFGNHFDNRGVEFLSNADQHWGLAHQ